MSPLARPDAPEFDQIRRSPRFKLKVGGRVALPGRAELVCRSIDMSISGVLLEAEIEVTPGETAVVSLTDLGRMEGRVTRATNSGFAVEFTGHGRGAAAS